MYSARNTFTIVIVPYSRGTLLRRSSPARRRSSVAGRQSRNVSFRNDATRPFFFRSKKTFSPRESRQIGSFCLHTCRLSVWTRPVLWANMPLFVEIAKTKTNETTSFLNIYNERPDRNKRHTFLVPKLRNHSRIV